MPIDYERVAGAPLPEATTSWDEDDVILYHLGLGAGVPATDPGELAYTYEPYLKVLPTFATIPPFGTILRLGEVEGLDFNFALLLHGEQELELHRPIPVEATVSHKGRIVDVFDKGKGALAVVEVESRTTDGELIFVNRSSLFLRGEGGFGGPSGSAPAHVEPNREPDAVFESKTMEQQALIYRLIGDKNPLHADPVVAALAGFERPILHGLASYGIVCKAVVDGVLDGAVERVRSYRARFAGPVVPGDTILTSVWVDGDVLTIAALNKDRGSPVISNSTITLG
jgi:acyl dehydratase